MVETLFHAYTPLVIWTGLGLLLFQYIPVNFPKLLSHFLFWIGIPLQIVVLARQSDFSGAVGFTPAIDIFVLFLSTSLAWLTWLLLRKLSAAHIKKPYFQGTNSLVNLFFVNFNSLKRSSQGSFILAAMLGNTGFVGLAITSSIISSFSLALFPFELHDRKTLHVCLSKARSLDRTFIKLTEVL